MAGLVDAFMAKVRRIVGLPEDPKTPPVMLHLPLCWAQVVAQNADSSVDVLPADARYPGKKNVPLAVPIPGSKVQVSPGALVILAWAYGDPGQAFALPIWGAGATLVSLALGDGTQVPLVNGVVLAKGVDPFTGATYGALGNASTTVMAKP